MIDIDDLIQAIDNYIDARNNLWERRRQLDEGDGYFADDEIEAEEQAKRDLEETINAYIDQRIEARLLARLGIITVKVMQGN